MCLAIPGQVESIHDDGGVRMGRVNFGGVVKEVCLAYLPDLAVGDFTIVHVGFALCRIDEGAARDTLRCFAEIGILEQDATNADRGNPRRFHRSAKWRKVRDDCGHGQLEEELAELGGGDDAGSPPS